jgi:hypothetical protein
MTVALNPGNPDCTQGLSKRIWEALVADGRDGVRLLDLPTTTGAQRAFCYAIARAVVQEIAEAAEVTVAVPRGALGPGLPTTAKTLQGRAR